MDTRTGDATPGRSARVSGGDPARACHDVLLAMAGRMPDRSLWRLRDWSAAGAGIALRTALPRTLVRHRVGVTEAERVLLRDAVAGWDGPGRLVDAVLHLDEVPDPSFAFAPEGPRPGRDTVDLALRALLPVTGVRELRRAWRRDVPGTRTSSPARVVLVRVDDHPDAASAVDLVALTGAVQRGLRALGERDPRVEVRGRAAPQTAYHTAATAGSELLWSAEDAAAVAPARGADSVSGELVPHG